MEQAYLVEEQELKERVFTEALRVVKLNSDSDKFWRGIVELQDAVMSYEVIRNRNDDIRKDEYREKGSMTKS